MKRKLALGLDFGTESARALLVDVQTGEEVGVAVQAYHHGVIDEVLPDSDVVLPPDWALQCPLDYLLALDSVIPAAMSQAGAESADVVGIGLDFTACTMMPVTIAGVPLCLEDAFRDRPHAWVKLWKHHGAAPEAEAINRIAASRNESFLKRYGGRTSSEWLLAKAWETLRHDPEVYAAADLFVEASDWVVWQLTGQLGRNACCAGYKGMWSAEEGYPGSDFLQALDPALADFSRTKLAGPVLSVGSRAGYLTETMARRFGLKAGTAVAVAIIDAHAAVPAAGIDGPGPMLMIMGTSTCQIALGREVVCFEGVAGVVQDGVLPGFVGYEAGQSATGDIYAWFVENAVPASLDQEAKSHGKSVYALLEQKASRLRVGQSGLMALDWWNGNRSVLMDAGLSGLLVGMTLDTKPEEVYRSLMEATVFGTRVILENFEKGGIPVSELIVCGGLAEKNALLMQINADICGRRLRLVRSGQASALGAAIFGAATAGKEAGGYDTVQAASIAMGGLKPKIYEPNSESSARYNQLYQEYLALHDWFGRGGSDVMKRLRSLRQ